MHKLSVKKLD